MAAPTAVLYVDGDPDFAERAAAALAESGDRFDVHVAGDVEAARDRLASGDVDCVVSEYATSPEDGLSFLDRVRDSSPDLPFVFFTGSGSERVASEAFNRGATDYVRKGAEDALDRLAESVRRHVSEARERERRERRLAAIETSREGIGILDEAGEFCYVNEACTDIYGYEAEELVGESWELVHPDSAVSFIEETVVPALFETGEWQGETVGVRADGSTFVEGHALSMTDGGEFICAIRDLTETRRRERELEQYETIVEAMGDGVYALDETGQLIEANENLTHLLGLDRDALEGMDPTAYLDEDTIETFQAAIADLVASDECSAVTVETTIRGEGCEPVPVEVTLTLLPGEDDEFRGTVGVVRDVSERTDRERELERYETLIELMPDTVVVTDLDGTITEVYGYDGWTGWEYDELIGAHFSKTIPDVHVPRVEELVADLVRSDDRSRATYETVLETDDGQQLHYENHITLLTAGEDDEVVGTMSVLRDVTNRVDHERELKRQNERLEEFTGIVSHDLRNPLNVATTRLQLAAAECDSDHLAAVERAHDRMERLIEDLLALAREGEAVEDERDLALANVAAAAWQTVDAADATLQVDADVTVHARESRLRQLLENLLANAIEHGGEDVTVRIGQVGDGRGFYVADDGPGIPPDERDQVFESGYTTAETGTGYGLSIVEEVAASHGWTVGVTESEAGGARFEITWDVV